VETVGRHARAVVNITERVDFWGRQGGAAGCDIGPTLVRHITHTHWVVSTPEEKEERREG